LRLSGDPLGRISSSRHQAYQEDGEDTGQKNAIEGARTSDRSDRGAESLDVPEVKQVGPDKRVPRLPAI